MFQLIRKDLLIQKMHAYFLGLLFMPSIILGSNRMFSLEIWGYALAICFFSYWLALFTNFNKQVEERLQSAMVNSLPVSRKEVVTAKYLGAMAWWVIAAVSVFTFVLLIDSFTSFSMPSISWRALGLSVLGMYLLLAIFYPLYFAFGYQLSAIFSVVIALGIMQGWGPLLVKWILGDPIVFNKIAHIELSTVLILAVLCIIFTIASYYLSIAIYNRKSL